MIGAASLTVDTALRHDALRFNKQRKQSVKNIVSTTKMPAGTMNNHSGPGMLVTTRGLFI
jgi:hypothetical protein